MSAQGATFRNGVANIAGKAWAALVALAFVPLYIRILGIEAYGLIGFFATLQSLFTLFDLGLSTTLNRELALRSLDTSRVQEARNLVRTLEAIYWAIALLIALVVVLLAPFIAAFWINAQSLPLATVERAVMLMGVTLAFQFPFAFYSGGLLGLQRQVLLNGITVAMATLRAVGALLVLWFVMPSVAAFFSWQVLVSALQTTLCAWAVWKSLPAAARPALQWDLLGTIWRFAAGMTGITVVSLLLSQLDKVIVSGLLPLAGFGYYALAGLVASGLYVLTTPLFSALFPRLTQLVSLGDEAGLIALYHSGCQVMAALVLPLGAVVALFARELLLVWSGDPLVADQTHLLVSLLVVGTALNGLMTVPYALQLAYGWTQLALYQNLIAVALCVPLLVWATGRYGAVGAASIWPLLNAGYVLFGIQAMHTRLLPAEKLRWYGQDVGLPLLGAVGVASLARMLLPADLSRLALLCYLGLTLAVTLAVTCCLTPSIAVWMRQRIEMSHRAHREHGAE